MSSIFCCSSIQAYRPQTISKEAVFRSFMTWANYPRETSLESGTAETNNLDELKDPFVIQLVKQVNFGPLESKRYFAAAGDAFVEVTEKQLIAANYKKLNAYKNFKCSTHNKFFEVNVYEKDPVNKHHWRQDIARPSGDIDL